LLPWDQVHGDRCVAAAASKERSAGERAGKKRGKAGNGGKVNADASLRPPPRPSPFDPDQADLARPQDSEAETLAVVSFKWSLVDDAMDYPIRVRGSMNFPFALACFASA